MDKAITSMTSYLCGVRDGPTLRPARGKRMNVANEEVLPITKTNSQCAGSHGSGPVPELGTDNIGTGNTPTLATLNGRRWDGWNIIREIQWPVASGQWPVSPLATSHCPLVTDYVWGLDIDGTLQGAGGVGGLLAVVRSDCAATNSSLFTLHSSLYFPTYDANGNICEYVTTNGEIVAHYDYSPFGETLIESGDLASSFTHRFSTKPWCPITGLYEYQMRKYRPEIGRWMNRDSFNTQDFLLYVFCDNSPLGCSDFIGFSKIPKNSNIFVTGIPKDLNSYKLAYQEAVKNGASRKHLERLRGAIKVLSRNAAQKGAATISTLNSIAAVFTSFLISNAAIAISNSFGFWGEEKPEMSISHSGAMSCNESDDLFIAKLVLVQSYALIDQKGALWGLAGRAKYENWIENSLELNWKCGCGDNIGSYQIKYEEKVSSETYSWLKGLLGQADVEIHVERIVIERDK